jgi:hypothetical protein
VSTRGKAIHWPDTLFFNKIMASVDNGNYYCKVKGSAATVTSSTLSLTVNPMPVASLSGLNTSYCAGDPAVSLSGLPTGGSFSGTSLTGNVFNPVNSGTYYLSYSVTNAQGCTATDVDTTVVYALPDAGFTGLATSYCNNSATVTLIPNTSGGIFSGNAVTGNVFDPSLYTLPLGLKQFTANMQTDWGLYAAAALIVSLPVMILFLILNRWLVSGLSLGSVKG